MSNVESDEDLITLMLLSLGPMSHVDFKTSTVKFYLNDDIKVHIYIQI